MEKIGVDHGICIITIVLNHNINHVIILVGFVEFFYFTRRLCILLELVSFHLCIILYIMKHFQITIAMSDTLCETWSKLDIVTFICFFLVPCTLYFQLTYFLTTRSKKTKKKWWPQNQSERSGKDTLEKMSTNLSNSSLNVLKTQLGMVYNKS